MKLSIAMKPNKYGNPVVNWNHWSVAPRVRLWLLLANGPYWLYSWCDDRNIIINPDGEGCWVGGYQLDVND